MSIRVLTTTSAVAAAASVALASAPAAAQKIEAKDIDLETWNYKQLYDDGFSAERFMQAEVVGEQGEHVGEIQDLVVTPGQGITHLIIETDGFLDIGDKHLRYPLAKADVESTDRVVTGIDEDVIEDYTLFPNVDDENLKGRMWRVSELIDDYAYLKNGQEYGYVEDAIIDESGQVRAVVVNSDVALDDKGGPYAFPFLGYESDYGFDPGADTYRAPYTRTEAETLSQFRYPNLEGRPTVALSGNDNGDKGDKGDTG